MLRRHTSYSEATAQEIDSEVRAIISAQFKRAHDIIHGNRDKLEVIANSLLEGEKIDFFVRGDGLQDLFGLGRTTGYNFAMGPAEVWVRAEDADNARVLLQDLIAAGEPRP